MRRAHKQLCVKGVRGVRSGGGSPRLLMLCCRCLEAQPPLPTRRG